MRVRVLLLVALLACSTSAAAVRWADVLKQPEAWYAGDEARTIADHVLLYQDASGGWPKNRNMALPPAAEAAARQHGVPDDETRPTIDNGATHTQLRFLARIITAGRGTPADRAAFDRGLDYLFAAQYPHGGWPQFYPLRPGYYTHITFNDDAMTGVLQVLHGVARGRAPFAFTTPAQRTRAAAAVTRGVDCILRCQVVIDGKKTAWCAQHDEHTFAPAPARKFEPATLSGLESVGLVRFLMSVEPTAGVVAAVEAAVAWFEAVKITGLRYDQVPDPSLPKGFDTAVASDPAAPPLWARFYELGTNRPVFTGRDGIVRYRLDEIEAERRGGYAWYVTAPEKLLNKDYPAWRLSLEAFSVANAERKTLSQYPQIHRTSGELPAGLTDREDLTYAPQRHLDLYLPAGPGPHPVALIVHGGGWDSGSREMERPFARQLAARGFATAPVSYRLGKAGRFPAALHDLKAAVRWLRVHATEHNLDPTRIAVIGMSAGGQLAALLGATNGLAEFEGAEGERSGSSAVQAVVDIDGLADFTAPELVAQQEAGPSAPVRLLGGKFSEQTENWRAASALTHAGPHSAPTFFINSTVTNPILPGREAMHDRLARGRGRKRAHRYSRTRRTRSGCFTRGSSRRWMPPTGFCAGASGWKTSLATPPGSALLGLCPPQPHRGSPISATAVTATRSSMPTTPIRMSCGSVQTTG
jgi:PelA/Pel-15E family pectate lyase